MDGLQRSKNIDAKKHEGSARDESERTTNEVHGAVVHPALVLRVNFAFVGAFGSFDHFFLMRVNDPTCGCRPHV